MEKELEELGSLRSKADAIHSRMTKSINEKYDENPAFYDSFSKRIKDTLQQYKEKIITDAEYLAKMRSIMADYASGVSDVKYPEKLKSNVHAQAFYGVVGAILNDEINKPSYAYKVAEESDYYVGTNQTKQDMIADIAIEITNIIEKHSMVDWTNNKTIHDRIAQDIDDLFYNYECARKLKLSFEVIDKVIENVKTTALRRFRG
jgi:type I restriction enzyme R subunit